MWYLNRNLEKVATEKNMQQTQPNGGTVNKLNIGKYVNDFFLCATLLKCKRFGCDTEVLL